MASDADWVEDVRRWYFAGRQDPSAGVALDPASGDADSIGYEAAHPALQAKNWPDAPIIAASSPPTDN